MSSSGGYTSDMLSSKPWRSGNAVHGRYVSQPKPTSEKLKFKRNRPSWCKVVQTYSLALSGPPDRAGGLKPLNVTHVDFHIDENTREHNTDKYDMAKERLDTSLTKLIVRRGQEFTVSVEFSRVFDEEEDRISLTFDIGDDPKLSKGTSKVLGTREGLKPRHWSAELTHVDNKTLTFRVATAPDAIIGRWIFGVDTMRRDEASEDERAVNVNDYTHADEPIYMLFNPWCKADLVFLPDEEERQEYVMNATGKIFLGNYKQITYKKWGFDQFEDEVLEICMGLLDLSGLGLGVRNDPAKIARAISKIVNSQDDNGVLEGNWSGDYSGGQRPTSWISSQDILEAYWQDKQSVKYGQCWVFSAVVTTVCRALGLPARSVTNFSSAHDCDGSISIDYHYDAMSREPFNDMNEDSVWNFHVWNEAWMARPDLGPHYSGWQAFDATPQETSDGVYQAGPFPVSAVKRGDLTVPYDGPFIFAEVNADKVSWFLNPENDESSSNWSKEIFRKHSVGRRISTQGPDSNKRLDITASYKFPEGSEEERAAVYRANQVSKMPGIYEDAKANDISFEVDIKEDLLVGKDFDIIIKMQNRSREYRTVDGTLTLRAAYYTGVPKGLVKKDRYDAIIIPPLKTGEAVMTVRAEEYLHLLVDHSFNLSLIFHVDETKQIFADEDTFRLQSPDIQIEIPIPGHLRKDIILPQRQQPRESVFEVVFTFSNPLPVPLTECMWGVKGPAYHKIPKIKQKDVEPYDTIELKVQLSGKRKGWKEFIVNFDCKELDDVTASHSVEIIAPLTNDKDGKSSPCSR